MKKVSMLLLCLVLLLTITACGNANKINKTVDIKEDSVKMTVLGSDTITVNEEGLLSIQNGEYTRVKMTIENYGEEEFNFSISFMLGDEAPSIKAAALDDNIGSVVAPGQTVTGYLYFDKTDAKELVYTSTNFQYDDGNIKTVQETFSIK